MVVNNGERVLTEPDHLKLLINNIDNLIWMVDTECTIIECNRAFKTWVSNFIGTELGKGDNVLFSGRNKLYLEKFEMCYQLALNTLYFCELSPGF